MEEEKILNVTQLGVVDKLQNEDVILLIRNTDNGKQCFQIKGFDFRGESAYEAALSQGFEGTYQDWVQQIKEVTEYDTKTLLSFKGIAFNDANKALTSGIYPNVTANIPITGETFTIQTLRTTTAVYNQYVSTQIAIGVTGAAIGKVYIRKNTQKSGGTTYGDWIDLTADTDITDTIYKYVAQQVTDGAWIPVKAGRDENGAIVDGAVAEGVETSASKEGAHAEGSKTVAKGAYSHAEGTSTKTSGQGAHAEGWISHAKGIWAHAEGYRTLAEGSYSHAEGYEVRALGHITHAEGIYNYYDSTDFIRILGVGSSDSDRINAEVVYIKRGDASLPDTSDPKNGYKYLLGIGGYTGKNITEGMKSIQEVISDLLSRIAILEAKTKPKTQYIIGKAIPIGKLNGGARLNAYAMRFGHFRFKLSNVPQIRFLISNNASSIKAIEELLKDVTWHLFINDIEVEILYAHLVYRGQVLQLYASLDGERDWNTFYQLDETQSSVDVSSDMYIYLKTPSAQDLTNAKGTSKTLYYHNGERIWEPNIQLPHIIFKGDILANYFNTCNLQLQKLLTRQRRSKKSGLVDTNISKFGYRGQRAYCRFTQFGIYRYRFVKDGKKTQWRTISILESKKYFFIK